MAQLKRKSTKKATPRKKLTAKRADQYHHGDLRSTLIEAALKLLETCSPSDLSLRDLAKMAGVSQAAPYRHFRDKGELYAAIAQQAFELKFRYIQEAIDEARGDPLKTFYATGMAYFRMGMNHPQHFRLMFSDCCKPFDRYPELKKAANSSFVLVREMVKLGQKAGIIGAGDPYHKAMNCWTVVHGFTALYTNGNFEWLGITSKNAEKALMTLLSQYLIGTRESLEKSSHGVKLFETPKSAPLREMMERIPGFG